MTDLSDILGSLMVSLVHARRMADEETVAIAEYYKDHPLLQGMSMPRVRVPELTIDMPITIDQHFDASDAGLDTPGNIHKALMSQLRSTLDDEDILNRTQNFQNIFDKEARKSLEKVYEQQKNSPVKSSREAMVRAVDDALQTSLKKANISSELTADKKAILIDDIRHKVSSVALKSTPQPARLSTSVTTNEIKEKSTSTSSVRLSITLREEGLEWGSSHSGSGSKRNHLQPE
ncbi:amidase [Bacterioplanoides sp.]|uniref:amidase n=1 Tax=Bacterioplanoides sp. TaxID=2066072 RepID=UPI003B00EFC1